MSNWLHALHFQLHIEILTLLTSPQLHSISGSDSSCECEFYMVNVYKGNIMTINRIKLLCEHEYTYNMDASLNKYCLPILSNDPILYNDLQYMFIGCKHDKTNDTNVGIKRLCKSYSHIPCGMEEFNSIWSNLRSMGWTANIVTSLFQHPL